ncbi:MAG: hypothetical protein K1X88_23340 [Nannocystaceae bacterium]|nr:hypothetical protein [Nannocystaceae bacterium]
MPRRPRPRRARTSVRATLALWALAPAAAAAAGPPLRPAAPPPSRPSDPDDAPMLPPPGGQPRGSDLRRGDTWSRGFSSRRRVALSLAPVFASYRMAFLGRPLQPIRGGGVVADVDVLLRAPVWVRAGAAYTAHALFDEFTQAEGEAPSASARRGTLHTLDVYGAVVFAMDLGRVRPVLEAGLGGLMVRTPRAVQDGQLGGACLDGGGCDVGLVCATEQNVCRQGMIPRVHAGAAFEVMLRDRWSVGVMIRYYALLLAPTVFPVYLQTGLRATLRF